MKKQSLISVVLPIYNEEKNIAPMYAALKELFLSQLPHFDYEIIFINDGSHDNSWREIEKLAVYDQHIKAICLSRNFGQQIALAAGYDYACGHAIISMDADLQHPVALLPEMIKLWQQGKKIVYARPIHRENSFLKICASKLFYRFLDSVSSIHIPRNTNDFRLVDAHVLHIVKTSGSRNPYWRGIFAWTGFSYEFINYNQSKRLHGSSSYTWAKLFKLGFDGLTHFSLFPLKIAAFIGFFVIASGCAMFTYITIDALFCKTYYPLFKWLVTIVYIFMGVQFLLMWILGEYIGRMFESQKKLPLYVVQEQLNTPSVHVTYQKRELYVTQ